MDAIRFSGAYWHSRDGHSRSGEAFYSSYTHRLPCCYRIGEVDAGLACLYFKQHFQHIIRDYLVLDIHKGSSGKQEYVVCYMLEKDIFVIFDETAAAVKILYNGKKDRVLPDIVHLCMNFKQVCP